MEQMPSKGSLAVVMITFNEEHHIGAVIDHIRDIASEIYVLDSLSTDKTVDIALEKGAQVLQRPFTNFGDQWNFALQHFPIQAEWTMKIDPDERLTESLKNSIKAAIAQSKDEAYAFSRRLWFMGKPLHSSQDIIRIWKTGHCVFSGHLVNEHPLVEHQVVQLQGFMEHLDSSSLYTWVQKQNRYTTMEAIALYRYKAGTSVVPTRGLKAWLKYNIYRIPFVFTLLYLYHLIAQGALLDGREGRIWAHQRVEVYRMRWYKYLEMVNLGGEVAVPPNKIGDYHPLVLGSKLHQDVFGK